MFQKEFAERLLDKKLNSINSLIKCFYDIKLNFNVSKNCFRPIPKVDSSIITLTKKNRKLINKDEINDFIVKINVKKLLSSIEEHNFKSDLIKVIKEEICFFGKF